jgi:hypothetical protein
MSRITGWALAGGLVLSVAAMSGPAAQAGGAPSGYQDCAYQQQVYQQALAGQAQVSASVARQSYEQCMKDHRYDGGEKRPPRHEHECNKPNCI